MLTRVIKRREVHCYCKVLLINYDEDLTSVPANRRHQLTEESKSGPKHSSKALIERHTNKWVTIILFSFLLVGFNALPKHMDNYNRNVFILKVD